MLSVFMMQEMEIRLAAKDMEVAELQCKLGEFAEMQCRLGEIVSSKLNPAHPAACCRLI